MVQDFVHPQYGYNLSDPTYPSYNHGCNLLPLLVEHPSSGRVWYARFVSGSSSVLVLPGRAVVSQPGRRFMVQKRTAQDKNRFFF